MASYIAYAQNPVKMKWNSGKDYTSGAMGWHSIPGMYAGGSVTFTRSSEQDTWVSYNGDITNTLSSESGSDGHYGNTEGSTTDHPIGVRVYAGNRLIQETIFTAPGYSKETKTITIKGSFEMPNNDEAVSVIYYCTDSGWGNCTATNAPVGQTTVFSMAAGQLKYVPYKPPTVSISAYNGDTIARADGTSLESQLQKVSITTSNSDGYTSTTRLTINGNPKEYNYGNGTQTGEFYPANYKVENHASYTVVANTVHDKKSDYTASDSITLYTYTPPSVSAILSTPTYAEISSGNYTKRVSPQDNAKITFTARTRGWGKSNRESAFQTFVQIGPKRLYDAAVVKDNTASDDIQLWSGEYTLNASGLATYLVTETTDYRNNAYYDIDMWINQYSSSADWWTDKIHRYVRMQFRPIKAAISGRVTSDADGNNGIGGKTLNIDEQATIYTFWDYSSSSGGAGVASGYTYTIGTGGTGASFVASSVTGTTSNKNKSFSTSKDLVRGKMNYIKIVPYYQSPNGTKYYAQNDKGEEQALYFQLIQPVSTLEAPIIDYPTDKGTWHNDSIRVCLQASEDPDFSTLGVKESDYRYGDVEIIVNDKKFLRSNINNFTMFSATDTSHKGTLVINISEGDGFVKANTYTIKVRFKKGYNLSTTDDKFNWSPQTIISVSKTEIKELTINKEDIIRASHFNGIRDAINKSCNCYNKTQTTLEPITAENQVIIDESEYKTLYDRLKAVQTLVNGYTTYKLEGETYVKFNNTFDQFDLAPTQEEKITAAKNKNISEATGRNYINLLREAINKLI